MPKISVLQNVIQPKAPHAAPVAKRSDAVNYLEDMEEITAALVENAPVAMAMLDRDLRYVLANRQWITDFALRSALPLVGRSQFEVFPNLHPGWRSVYERALQGHVIRSEHDILPGQGGRSMICRWEVRPWRRSRDAAVIGIMVTCEKFIRGTESTGEANEPGSAPLPTLPQCSLPMAILSAAGDLEQSNDAFKLGTHSGTGPIWELLAEGGEQAKVIQADVLVHAGRLLAEPNAKHSLSSTLPLKNKDTQWVICQVQHVGRIGLLIVGAPQTASAISASLMPPATLFVPAAPVADPAKDATIEKLESQLDELKKLEAAYKRREGRHREVLDTMPCGLVVLDERGRPIFQNAHVKSLVGRELATGGSVEQWLCDACIDPAAKTEVAATWRDDIWRRELTKIISLTTADGLMKDLEFRPTPLPNGGLLLTIHDVSEACHLEEMLHAVEAKFRTVLRDCPVPVLLTDAGGSIFEANAEAEALLGKSRNELRRTRLDDLLSPQESLSFSAALKRMAEQGQSSTSLPVSLAEKDGTLGVSLIRNPDGKLHALAHFFQVAVQAAQPPVIPPAIPEQLDQPAEPVVEVITTLEWKPLLQTDAQGRIVEWLDEVATPLFGWTTSTLGNRWLHQLFRPSDATGFYADLRSSLESEDAVTWRWYGADGRSGETEFQLRRRPDGEAAVELLQHVEVVQTITPSAEPPPLPLPNLPAPMPGKANTFLIAPGPAVFWNNSDLSRERMLITETHHRVKNHLQIISSLLNLQSNNVDDEVTRNHLRSSQNRVKAVAALHQHLFQLQLGQTLSLVDFTEELIPRLRECYDVGADRVAVEIYLADAQIKEEWLMPCALILNEALSNAFEHAFPDGRQGVVRVSFSVDEGCGHLTVTDNGIGLPEGFAQVDASTQSMGLKVMGIFSDQMGGQINLKNIVGKGVSFDLQFPMTCVDI